MSIKSSSIFLLLLFYNSFAINLASMKFISFLFFLLFYINSGAQVHSSYVKLSGGYCLFGYGDVPGYSIRMEFAHNIAKNSRQKLGKLFIGPELSFESGVKNPKVQNPNLSEFASKTFYHITNTTFSLKASYYPFRKIIPGFNVSGAASIGYSARSTESKASLISLGNGQTYRSSQLTFDNGFTYGYRISSGYDVQIARKYSVGVVLGLDNFEGEFNSFWGANMALHF